ncbi:MAG: methyltransferase domain-containing protein [Verrucomicrobiota bacterium]|nr:methyltransferase domain-containing protein [Verrucomicrobiota bacterium]
MTRRLITTLADSTLFLREWLAHPQRTGAVAPSSSKLAAAMASWLPANSDDFVLELGPGTGVVTAALLNRGLRQERLLAIEKNVKLARLLRGRFPDAQILIGDATQLDEVLRQCLEPVESVGAVISSLPLLNFPPAAADLLARKIHAILKPAGRWVQFSYRLGRARLRGTEAFRQISADIVWLNLPPARVNVYQK